MIGCERVSLAIQRFSPLSGPRRGKHLTHVKQPDASVNLTSLQRPSKLLPARSLDRIRPSGRRTGVQSRCAWLAGLRVSGRGERALSLLHLQRAPSTLFLTTVWPCREPSCPSHIPFSTLALPAASDLIFRGIGGCTATALDLHAPHAPSPRRAPSL